MYPFILDITKTNGVITLSKYPTEYFKLVFVSTNFEITRLPTLTSQIFFVIFSTIKLFFCYFRLAKSQHYYTVKKKICHYFLTN